MKFSYNWLKSLYPKIPSPEKTAELLTLHAFQVEEIKKLSKDFQLDIDVLANRVADASGHLGIARELAAIEGKDFSAPEAAVKESAVKTADMVSVKIESRASVLRYAARVIEDVRVKVSPAWLKERLEVCGLRPINAIVDATNYVMLETGQPLHAFDYDKLHGGTKKEIIARSAKRGETMKTLDDQMLELLPEDILIADPAGPIALGGIKGGMGSEISENTTRIALEAANFDPAQVRKTSRRLSLRTDASHRFEHGVSPEIIPYALDRAAELIADLAGGKIAQGITEQYPKRDKRSEIPFRLGYAESLLGVKVSEAEASGILKRLGFDLKRRSARTYAVTPPVWRVDITIEEDLIEEVGRIAGYEKIKPAFPPITAGVPRQESRRMMERTIAERLVGFGFTEMHVPAFIGENLLAAYGIDPARAYHLENPANPETACLANLALLNYTAAIAENQRNFAAIKVFGFGRNFLKTPKGPAEERSVFLGVSEKGRNGKEEFYYLKGVIEAFLESFGIGSVAFVSGGRDLGWAHPHRAANIVAAGARIGAIGEVGGFIQEKLKAKSSITIAEFDLRALLALAESETKFRPIGKFPAVGRDLALVVPENERYQSVKNVIAGAGGNDLADIDFFDAYEGSAVGKDKKSLAFHLIFQSLERTLTDEAVRAAMDKIINAAKKKGWEARS